MIRKETSFYWRTWGKLITAVPQFSGLAQWKNWRRMNFWITRGLILLCHLFYSLPFPIPRTESPSQVLWAPSLSPTKHYNTRTLPKTNRNYFKRHWTKRKKNQCVWLFPCKTDEKPFPLWENASQTFCLEIIKFHNILWAFSCNTMDPSNKVLCCFPPRIQWEPYSIAAVLSVQFGDKLISYGKYVFTLEHGGMNTSQLNAKISCGGYSGNQKGTVSFWLLLSLLVKENIELRYFCQ